MLAFRGVIILQVVGLKTCNLLWFPQKQVTCSKCFHQIGGIIFLVGGWTTHLKNMNQIGSFPKGKGWKWNQKIFETTTYFLFISFPTFRWIESMRPQRNPMSFSRLWRASHPRNKFCVEKKQKNTNCKMFVESLRTVFSVIFCVLICQVALLLMMTLRLLWENVSSIHSDH